MSKFRDYKTHWHVIRDIADHLEKEGGQQAAKSLRDKCDSINLPSELLYSVIDDLKTIERKGYSEQTTQLTTDYIHFLNESFFRPPFWRPLLKKIVKSLRVGGKN